MDNTTRGASLSPGAEPITQKPIARSFNNQTEAIEKLLILVDDLENHLSTVLTHEPQQTTGQLVDGNPPSASLVSIIEGNTERISRVYQRIIDIKKRLQI